MIPVVLLLIILKTFFIQRVKRDLQRAAGTADTDEVCQSLEAISDRDCAATC